MCDLTAKTIIVDVDGTIANCEHRLKYVHSRPRQWKKFLEEADNDTAYEDIVWLVNLLFDQGCNVLIVTARSEDQREQTKEWLYKVAGIHYHKMYMRESGDFRDDGTVKEELLEDIYRDGFVPFMVFDDRDRVVEMWREKGLRCLQVAKGNF